MWQKIKAALKAVNDKASAMVVAPVAAAVGQAAAPADTASVVPYEIGYTMVQSGSLNIQLDTSQLFSGAQLMIDALSSPYLLIAGLGLGVAILGAIVGAVNKVRI